MDDRFKTLLERSVIDAIDVWEDVGGRGEVQVGPEFVQDAAMQLYQQRCQRYMMRWQMEKQQEMMSQTPNTDSGFGMQ